MSTQVTSAPLMADGGVHWQQLHFSGFVSPRALLAFTRSLAVDTARPDVVLEIRGGGGILTYLLGTYGTYVGQLYTLVRDFLPAVSVTPFDGERAKVVAARQVRLSSPHRPLDVNQPVDVVRAVRSALMLAKSRESLVLQYHLGSGLPARAVPHRLPASAVQPWWQAAWDGPGNKLDGEARAALTDKLHLPGIKLTIRLGVIAVKTARREQLLKGLIAGLRTAEAPGVSLGTVAESGERLHHLHRPWRWPVRLNIAELVPLLGLPLGSDGDAPLPGQGPTHPRPVAPVQLAREGDRILAEATAPGATGKLGYSMIDACKHSWVIGPNGTGKSSLLSSLVLQDAAAGRGIVVIEPKDLVADIEERLPASRHRDVVRLDPLDSAPVGISPLQRHGRTPEVVADNVFATFSALYGDQLGPRSADILRNSLVTLARQDNASLVMLPLLLTNTGFRRSLTQHAMRDDPIVNGPFWQWFEGLTPEARSTIVAPLHNKLRPLLTPVMRGVLGQRTPRFNIRQVLTERKILLVPLQPGLVGPETAELLAGLVIGELWQALQERVTLSPSERHPVAVFIDEAQTYMRTPTDLSEALAMSRSLGAGFHLAHQYRDQLSPSMLAAFEANARSRIAFQLSPRDAKAFAFGQSTLTPEDFSSLPAFHIYASLVQGNTVTPWASGRTLPPTPPTNDVAKLRQTSREQYGQPLSDIEASFTALLTDNSTTDSTPTVSGRRPRRTS